MDWAVMIMITGGLGLIGSHTARALLDRGESCVLVQRREPGPAPLFPDELGGRVLLEQADAADLRSLLAIGERRPITGIVHLAGAYFGDPVTDARTNVNALLNVVEAGKVWGVRRVGVASTIGVYSPADPSPWREDQPLPLTAPHSIAAGKKVDEVLVSHLGAALGIDMYAARIGAIWGPLGRLSSRFFAIPQLILAAATGTEPKLDTLPGGRFPHADEGIDALYVRDCGRALAALQLADRLEHDVYNVSGGRLTTYRELAEAIAAAVPGTRYELPEGRDPQSHLPQAHLDISRLRADTDYEPEYDTERAVADYVAWLRAGHER
jgi:UDP-glucose 4-epimerase